MMSDIETTDIKASYTVSRVLWTLLNTIFGDDDDEEILTFADKELLEDILRYGTIAEVAKRKNTSASTIGHRLSQSLSHLEKKIKWIEIHEHQQKRDLKNCQKLLSDSEQKYKELEEELKETRAKLCLAQYELIREKDWPELQEERLKFDLVKSGLMQRDQKTLVKEIIFLHTLNRKLQEELGASRQEIESLDQTASQLESMREDLQTVSQLRAELETKNAEIASLRKENFKKTSESIRYENLYTKSQKTVEQLRKENQSLKVVVKRYSTETNKGLRKMRSARENRLLRKIDTLENLVEWYKSTKAHDAELPPQMRKI